MTSEVSLPEMSDNIVDFSKDHYLEIIKPEQNIIFQNP
jgi:hypothetical protein